MQWEKKICIRITIRRMVGAILAASTVANLIIVGAVFGADSPLAAPTATSAVTMPLSTRTFFFVTSTAEEAGAFSSTQTPDAIPTATFTPTPTSTESRLWIICVKRFFWPTYRIQQGDTLFSIASATGSTVNELIAANCLSNDRIYVGQLLHVPRLPNDALTATLSSTPTDTPTATQTLTYTPTITLTTTATTTATDTPTATSTDTPSPTPTATNSPPNVMIIFPVDGSVYPRDGFDRNLNLWYSIIELRGSASDLEDDVLSDSALVWSTDRSDIQNAVLGTGLIIKATLYSNVCSGGSHTITLTGRDRQDAASTATIKIFIGLAQQC